MQSASNVISAPMSVLNLIDSEMKTWKASFIRNKDGIFSVKSANLLAFGQV